MAQSRNPFITSTRKPDLGKTTGGWISIMTRILRTVFVLILLAACGGGTNNQPYFSVELYDSTKACNGTTLFAESHDSDNPRVVEMDMDGNIVWEYSLPDSLKQYTQPGFEAEVISSTDHILMVLPGKGIYEIDRDGNIVWYHEDEKCSHDADRLPNGNTIYVYGDNDTKSDAQVKEVDSNGDLVWEWHASQDFDVEPYSNISDQGWTHTNAVTRLTNGNTLVGLRNLQLTAVVRPDGSLARTYDWATLSNSADPDPHDPEVESDGTLLVALQNDSQYQGFEINADDEEIMWTYSREGLRTTRDCDRLLNGNTLLVGVMGTDDESVIFEVTPDGEIVWELRLKNASVGQDPGWFYKAQRICE